jgi:hypothetical protein
VGLRFNPCYPCPKSLPYLRAALRAELGAFRIRAAAGALGRGGRAFDLLTAVGAELRSTGSRATLGTTIGDRLNHLRAAFGAEFGTGLG